MCSGQVVREGRRPGTVRSFLDSTQYSTRSILRYERIFGSGYVSTGGVDTTKVGVAESSASLGSCRHTHAGHWASCGAFGMRLHRQDTRQHSSSQGSHSYVATLQTSCWP